jgi:O-antigen/teichoic acid export membrane protein
VALYNLYFIFWVGANVAKKNRMIPLITLIASAVNVGLNFVLVPVYGMWAAAWTTTLGFAILATLVFFVSQHWYPVPFEWRRLLKLLLATGIALLGVAGVDRGTGLSVTMATGELFAATAASTAVAVLLFALTLRLTGFFTAGERAKLAAAGRRLTGRREAAVAVPVEARFGAASALHPADHLSEDDVAAEEEALELEKVADIKLTEGDDTIL